MNLHPQYIRKNDADEYVVLPINEFYAVVKMLEDYQDLQDLRSAKKDESEAATKSLADVVKELHLDKVM